MNTEPPVAIGDIVADKYRIVGLLGAGGMGVVMQAEHLELGQMVALKFLRAGTSADVAAGERFLREARAAVRIRSEHVARVLDVGRLDNGTPYMVMEYLEGRDLGQVIASDAPVPVAVGVGYILQACEALAEAHVAGLVHRDLKPTNVFVTARADGSALVKVLDFGISKAMETGGGAELALTTTGVILGSPLYMSPEQLRSTRAVDTRTDIWSLGIVLHELLTSRHAFEADSMPTLCAMIAADPPKPLRSLRPDAPAGLEEAISRCLQKEPADRFGSVADLARALLPFAGPEGLVSVERIVRVMVGSSATAVSPMRLTPAPRGARTLARRRGLGVGIVLLAALLGAGLAIRLPKRASGDAISNTKAASQPSASSTAVTPYSLSVALPSASASAGSLPIPSAAPSPPPLATASPRLAPIPTTPSRARGIPYSPTSPPSPSATSHSAPGEPLDPLVDQR